MFSKVLKKKKKEPDSEVVQKISKMNLSDMRVYVNNKLKDFQVSEEGLVAIMDRLTMQESTTKKLYLDEDAMDSKKKKTFDLVLLIAKSKKINLKVLEKIQLFQTLYKNIIEDFDKRNTQIYYSKIDDAIKMAIEHLHQKAEIKKKMAILDKH